MLFRYSYLPATKVHYTLYKVQNMHYASFVLLSFVVYLSFSISICIFSSGLAVN